MTHAVTSSCLLPFLQGGTGGWWWNCFLLVVVVVVVVLVTFLLGRQPLQPMPGEGARPLIHINWLGLGPGQGTGVRLGLVLGPLLVERRLGVLFLFVG